MDFLHSLLVATHFIGLALLIGTFFVQMRANWGFNFTLMLVGASIQLVTGVALYGMVMAGDTTPNHMKLGIKGLIALVVFIAALVGFLQQRKLRAQKAAVSTGGAVEGASVAGAVNEKAVKPFFHAAGGFAIINLLIAVFWR